MEEEIKFKPKEYYREKIIKMINSIDKMDILQYLDTFIRLFIEKWG